MHLLVSIAFMISLSHPAAAPTGLVAYDTLHSKRSDLAAYADSLARYSPESHPRLFPERDYSLAPTGGSMPTTHSFCAGLSTPIPSPVAKTPSS